MKCPHCDKTHSIDGVKYIGCDGSLADYKRTGIIGYPVSEPDKNPNRKNNPVFSGVLAYFPDALVAVSQHSQKGNDKHNPGLPLHWDKTKSNDHADALARHLLDIGPNWNQRDSETGSYHATAVAWRALALLQTLLEKEKK